MSATSRALLLALLVAMPSSVAGQDYLIPGRPPQNAKQLWIFSGDENLFDFTTTDYVLPQSPETVVFGTSANRFAPMPAAGTLSDMACVMSGDVGDADDVTTFTIQKDTGSGFADTAMNCVVDGTNPGTTAVCSGSATFAVGELIRMKIATVEGGDTGAVAVIPRCYMTWTPNTANEFVWIGQFTSSLTATQYHSMQGRSVDNGTLGALAAVMPVAGSIEAVYLWQPEEVTSGSRTFSIMYDASGVPASAAADADFTCVIDNASPAFSDGVGCSDTSATVDVALGSTVELRDVAASPSPSNANTGYGIRFKPTTPGEFPVFVNISGCSIIDNRYYQVSAGRYVANATESTSQALVPAFTAKRLYVGFTNAPTGAGFDITLMEAGAPTSLSCNVPIGGGKTCNDSGGDEAIAAGALIDFLCDPEGGAATGPSSSRFSIGATFP